ncbi:MAG: hypothetical protein ACRC35_07665 [Angustibacter sp.]
MSQPLAVGRRSPSAGRVRAGAARGPRPALRVVRPPSPDRGRSVFAGVCLALLGAGLIGLLVVNTALAQGSFRLHDLRESTDRLDDREQLLRQDIDRRAAPEQLARRARQLGMVSSGPPAFIRLRDGRVLGSARAAPTPRASAPGDRSEAASRGPDDPAEASRPGASPTATSGRATPDQGTDDQGTGDQPAAQADRRNATSTVTPSPRRRD